MLELKDTVRLMNSSDYKNRFIAEYVQTKLRYDKLHAMLVKLEAGTLDFTPVCDKWTLQKQASNMGSYLECLEIRGAKEHIKLPVPVLRDPDDCVSEPHGECVVKSDKTTCTAVDAAGVSATYTKKFVKE